MSRFDDVGASVAGVNVRLPAVGESWPLVFGWESAVSVAWTVEVDGTVVATASPPATTLTATIPASGVGKAWSLLKGGTTVATGFVLVARPGEAVTDGVTVTDGDGVTVTIADPTGGGAPLSNDLPLALGTASAGVGVEASRDDHVHPMPSAGDVDAVPVGAVGLEPGERNRGAWDVATAYVPGDVVVEGTDAYVCTAASVGELPSATPGKWDLVLWAGRGVALGPGSSALGDYATALGPGSSAAGDHATVIGRGSSAAGDHATALGPGSSAAGDGATAIGPGSSASGDNATAIGLWSAAGDYATAIGPGSSAAGDGATAIGPVSSASGNGDVNIANLITGHITDPLGSPTPDGLTLATGFVDLPETSVVTNPAADHQRLVARTDGLYVRDETGTEVGPLGAAHAASHQDGGSDELALDGSQITSGTVAAARLGTGTPSVSTVLHGDGVWRRALPLSRPNVQYEYRTLAGGTTSSTLAAIELTAAGKLNSHPVFLRAGTYDRIGVFTTVAGTSTYRLGVYPSFDDRLEPDGSALLIDCGVIDVSAAPGLLLRTATITIPYDGVWHFAVLCETYTSRPTIHGWAGGTSLPLFPFQGVFSYGFPVGRAAFGRVATGVATGAMPATFPAATHSDSLPQIVARCA